MNTKYALEFILHAKAASTKIIKSSLAEFGNDLAVSQTDEEKQRSDYKINMMTEDPTLVFDLCSQFGRIRSVKVQESVV